jgi:GTPase SAR1 family protein
MWIEEVKNTKRDDILIYILGNKADLVNERKVATDAGVALA